MMREYDLKAGEGVSYHHAQFTLDAIYDRVDEVAQMGLRGINLHPLPKEFDVMWSKFYAASDKAKEDRREYLKPRLITPNPRLITKSPENLIMAIENRNLDPPKLYETRNANLVDSVVDNFFDTFIDAEKLAIAKERMSPTNMNILAEWERSRTTSTKKNMEAVYGRDVF
eukprot:GHVR01187259.1.p1 GENE.GHVR01187259.1~~GHVR01187259.1.p1  ORF type:complete len:170 (+),score=24.17 GHVR01187259.1:393-902(+)